MDDFHVPPVLYWVPCHKLNAVAVRSIRTRPKNLPKAGLRSTTRLELGSLLVGLEAHHEGSG